MPFILTRPAQPLTGIPGTVVPNVPVSSGATAVVDFMLSVNNISAKWIVTVHNTTTNEIRVSEVLAFHNGTTPTHTVYGIIGDTINYNLDVNIAGPYFQLEITNNETDVLDVSIVRIQTVQK